MAELEAVPAMWVVLHHGSRVTGRVLGLFSLSLTFNWNEC